jgi:antitoxin component YwqK of YwqJK toxin-antitoxin module
MKYIKVLILSLVISLLSLPSWGETMDDLVERNGLFYKKFTDTPFTGELSGQDNGMMKDGKPDGFWIYYYGDGQLNAKANYKDGKLDGFLKEYSVTGYFYSKENYKDGELDGVSESYYENGQLKRIENYKDREKDGVIKKYNEDGSLLRIEIWIDGVKQ